MKTFLDCYPCFLDQALRAGRMATDDEKKIKELLDVVGCMIKDIPMEHTPPETGEVIYRKVRELTGVEDPYKSVKQSSIQEALDLVPELKKMIDEADDRLLAAIRLAIAGNLIDLGVRRQFVLTDEIGKIMNQDFAIFDYAAFRKHLDNTSSVLYIGDNAGESVFDRILIEELGKPVTYAVRDIPVINDVTMEDAIASGIGDVAEIISSGSTAPGAILRFCNALFLEKFEHSDLIISKGQGNYEALSEVNRPVFFLLKAKCKVIAGDLDVRVDDIVLKGINT
ncbi:MAG TPA: DUF89 family protein [Bacteroides sp.]|nr:DUF89 family protein [Bacteroides sp.]